MTDINLNIFGSLTTSAGKKLDFKDFDTNNDGTISAEEYNAVVKEQQLDTVSFATVNTDTEDDITATEFETWQTKLSLQDELKKLLEDHKTDFDQYPSCYTDVAIGLRKFMQSYDFTNIPKENIIEDFKTKLEAEYEKLYESAYNNSPEVIADKKGASIDNVIESILEEQATTFQLNDEEKEIFFQKLGDILSGYAEVYPEEFVVGKETEWETALKENLYKRLDGSDKGFIITEELDSKFITFQDIYDSLGNYVTKSEMAKLKLAAIEVVKNILKQGGLIQLNGKNMTSESIITGTIENDFASADKLYEAIIALKPKSAENTEGGSDTLIASLVKETRDAIIDKKYKEEQEELAKLEAIKGSDFAINAINDSIDFSDINGYYDNKTINIKRTRKRGNLNVARDEVNSEIRKQIQKLKDDFKSVITQKAEKLGIKFEDIETIFENAFNQATVETLEQFVISSPSKFLKRSSATCNVKEAIDGFVNTFNNKIASIYDGLNESRTDLNLENIDYSVAFEGKEYLEKAYNNNTTIVYRGRKTKLQGSNDDSVVRILAEKILNAIKDTLLERAKSMCSANGIEFNENSFNAHFNNAKAAAIAAGIMEYDHIENDQSGVYNDMKNDFKEFTGGYRLRVDQHASAISPSVLLNTLTSEFKTNYTAWVEAEKAKI